VSCSEEEILLLKGSEGFVCSKEYRSEYSTSISSIGEESDRTSQELLDKEDLPFFEVWLSAKVDLLEGMGGDGLGEEEEEEFDEELEI